MEFQVQPIPLSLQQLKYSKLGEQPTHGCLVPLPAQVIINVLQCNGKEKLWDSKLHQMVYAILAIIIYHWTFSPFYIV